MLSKRHFFDSVRQTLFRGNLSQKQVDGMNNILDYISENYPQMKPSHAAYILATAYHETGRRMQPVREGFAKSDKQAIKIITRMYQKGRIRRNYAKPNEFGLSYFGRGYVQLTWEDNYKKMSKVVGEDLHKNPNLVLDPKISVAVLVEGMVKGMFTGKKLSSYLKREEDIYTNFKKARRIVNGQDKASTIAGYAKSFQNAVVEAKENYDPVLVADTKETDLLDMVTGKREYESTTIMATVVSAFSTIGGTIASIAENNPGIAYTMIAVALLTGGYIIYERRKKRIEWGV